MRMKTNYSLFAIPLSLYKKNGQIKINILRAVQKGENYEAFKEIP